MVWEVELWPTTPALNPPALTASQPAEANACPPVAVSNPAQIAPMPAKRRAAARMCADTDAPSSAARVLPANFSGTPDSPGLQPTTCKTGRLCLRCNYSKEFSRQATCAPSEAKVPRNVRFGSKPEILRTSNSCLQCFESGRDRAAPGSEK